MRMTFVLRSKNGRPEKRRAKIAPKMYAKSFHVVQSPQRISANRLFTNDIFPGARKK